jgi:hypothetical protein
MPAEETSELEQNAEPDEESGEAGTEEKVS